MEWIYNVLIVLLIIHKCVGQDVNIGVPTSTFSELAEFVKKDLRTNNKFIFSTLPNITGNDEMTIRENLLKALKKERIDMVLGYYEERTAVISRKLRIPYIVTSFGIPDTGNHVFQVLPPLNDIVDCVLDVVKAFAWTKVGLLCEESILSLYTDPRLLSEMVRDPVLDVRLWVLPARRPADQLWNILVQARKLDVKQILLFTSVTTSHSVLDQAKHMGMLAYPYSWVMLNLGSEPFPTSLGLGDLVTNITTINLVLPLPETFPESTFTTVNAESTTTTPSHRDAPSENEGISQYSNLEVSVMTDSLNFMDRIAHLRRRQADRISKKEFLGRTGNLQLGEDGVRNKFTFGLFSPVDGQLSQTGSWHKIGNQHKLFMLPKKGNVTFDENSLKGKHVKIVGVLEDPWLMALDQPDENGLIYKGYSVDLVKEIARRIGFTFEFYLAADGKFGSRHENGMWDGIVGDVMSGKADMSAAPLRIDADREEAVDFTVPYMHRGITILVRSPELQNDYFKFMLPFTTQVWLAVLGALALFSIVLCLIEAKGKAWRSDLPRLNTSAESWWFTFGALVGGGTESSPVTLAGRVLTSAWWFFGLILISTYTANLAAFLTVQIINPPITGVEDLLGQDKISYGTVRETGIETFFRNVTLKPYSELYTQMVLRGSNVDSPNEGIARVKDGDYAFLWDDSVNAYMAATDCNYTNIGPPFEIKGFGVSLPTGALYKDELSLVILRMGDEGLLSRLEHKWWAKSKCPDLSRPSITPSGSPAIDTENVAGIFFVVAAGIVISVFIWLIECTVTTAKRSKCCKN